MAVVVHPWYEVNGRKYIDLELEGIVRRVKIPFRYNRVMCNVTGIMPIQSIPVGTTVDCLVENVMGHLVLRSIRPL
jgi:ribosomal protein L2